jgi:hypothetical protein
MGPLVYGGDMWQPSPLLACFYLAENRGGREPSISSSLFLTFPTAELHNAVFPTAELHNAMFVVAINAVFQ